MKTTKHYAFALIEEFTHVPFSCAIDPLRIANLLSGQDLYRWSLLSENGETAQSSNGIYTQVDHDFSNVPQCDRFFVLSGLNMRQHITKSLTIMLRRENTHGRKIGALCSGAWILAELGFLNGKKAAIHWEYHDAFMEKFPDVNLVRNVFVADEKHLTASGGTATADLMLHLIERDHGADLSQAVADQMVYTSVREATAEQRVSLQSRNGMRNTHLAKAIQRMHETIDAPISPSRIAEEIGISTRQLERLFGKYLNTSPKKYYMEMRLERARKLLVQTESSVIDIAMACGFESAGHFSRVYKATYGITPTLQKSRLS